MAQDVVNVLFAGDSRDLLARYAEGVRTFDQADGTPPEHVVIAHTEEGLHVTLVWAEGVDHELLGRFLLGRLEELGLPRPRVIHGTLATASWDSLIGAAAES